MEIPLTPTHQRDEAKHKMRYVEGKEEPIFHVQAQSDKEKISHSYQEILLIFKPTAFARDSSQKL